MDTSKPKQYGTNETVQYLNDIVNGTLHYYSTNFVVITHIQDPGLSHKPAQIFFSSCYHSVIRLRYQ